MVEVMGSLEESSGNSQPPPSPIPGGRIHRGFVLLGRSWDLLRARPRLFVLPAIATVATLVGALLIFIPVLWATRDQPDKVSFLIAAAASALPFTIVGTFCNVGFLAMVRMHLRGEEPTVRAGLAVARSKLRPILVWSLISAIVGTALRALEDLPGAQVLGSLLSLIGGLAWSLGTFFVVPVLVLEDRSAAQSMRRSAEVFRRRWGEEFTGQLAIGAACGILALPGAIVAVVALMTFDEHRFGAGLALAAAAAVLIAPVMVLSSALTEMFSMMLYREATTGVASGPFSEGELYSVLEPKKPSWWRRLRGG
jgi:hypothetical protein